MKRTLFLLITGCFLFLNACEEEEFLDRNPKASPNPKNFFIDASSARMAVNACPLPWTRQNYMMKRNMGAVLEGISDDAWYRQSGAPEIALCNWDVNSVNRNVVAWWTYPYQCINNANFAIDNIPLSSDPNFTPEQQAPYIAEAKFYRAYSYIFLTAFFGDVPLFTSAASGFDEFYKPRTPKADILEQVVEDLTYAKDNLPTSQPSAKGAPTKATGAAMLAKAQLFRKDWVAAESAAREAVQIAESSGYHMLDNYLDNWSQEGNAELLFYWGYVENNGDYGQNFTVYRNCRDLPATLRISILGDGFGYLIPNRDLYDEFEGGDPRREFTLYSPGHDYEVYPGPADFPYTHEIYDASGKKVQWNVTYKAGDMVQYDYRWSPTGLNIRKMTKSLRDDVRVEWDGLDCPVMRMSELYLILAEALAEQGKPEALTWVNKVRSRPSVNIPGRALNDGKKGDNSLVDIVRHERRVELAGEGLRILDLIRWGTLYTVFGDGTKVKRHFFSDFLPAGNAAKYSKPVSAIRNPVLPTPQDEIDTNPALTQDPAWAN